MVRDNHIFLTSDYLEGVGGADLGREGGGEGGKGRTRTFLQCRSAWMRDSFLSR